jgi:UDP-N-acetyl-D-galactosamine dehydrogenase
MGSYVARELVKEMIRRSTQVKNARVLIMGLAFKENCPDLRNTRVTDIIAELADYGVQLDVWDPWIDAAEAKHEYDLDMVEAPDTAAYDGIVLAVAHEQFGKMGAAQIRALGTPTSVLFDVKSLLPKGAADLRL